MTIKNIFKLMMMLLGVMAFSIAFVSCGDDDKDVLAESISLDKTELSVPMGKTAQLTATILPKNVTDKMVSFSSSNEKIATVDALGKITAIAFGTADIIAKTKVGSKKATCKVMVIASEANFLGEWYLEKNITDGKELVWEHSCATKKDYTKFLPNGIIESISYNSKCEKNIDSDTKWEISGNTLTITETYVSPSGVNFTSKSIYTIKNLTANTVVLHYDKHIENGKEQLIDENEDGKADDTTIYLVKLQ